MYVQERIKDSPKIAPKDIQSTAYPSTISAVEKVLYVLLFALLIGIRIPQILTEGRFWGEEGSVFFKQACCLPWYKALLLPYAGYLNFPATLAGVMAKNLVPLRYACFVPSIIALIIQTFPAILLCASRERWLQDRKILLASLLIIATLPNSHEVWLSSISSQFHLNLCVSIILTLETRTGLLALFQYALLLLAPLSGPGAICLLPLFIIRSVIDRSKQRIIQSCVLGLGAFLQIFIFYQSQQRSFGIEPVLLGDVFFIKHILSPFLGQHESHDLSFFVHYSYVFGHTMAIKLALVTLITFAILATTIWRSQKAPPIYFFSCALILSALSYFGSLGVDRSDLLDPIAGNRYAFTPQILFELAILSLSCLSFGWTRLISRSIIIWVIVIGLHEYFCTPDIFATGPNWRSEIGQWQKDPNHSIAVWPSGIVFFKMDPKLVLKP
jgi:hypothetical protein